MQSTLLLKFTTENCTLLVIFMISGGTEDLVKKKYTPSYCLKYVNLVIKKRKILK